LLKKIPSAEGIFEAVDLLLSTASLSGYPLVPFAQLENSVFSINKMSPSKFYKGQRERRSLYCLWMKNVPPIKIIQNIVVYGLVV
jgi:hypothetical protein